MRYRYMLAVIAGTTLFSACGNRSSVTLNQESISVELGDASSLPKEASAYISSNKIDDLENYSVDISNVNINKVGIYEITISNSKGKQFKVNASVIDTTAPQILYSTNSAFLVGKDTEINIQLTNESEESISDLSKFDYGFTTPKKVTDVFSYEDIALYREKNNENMKSVTVKNKDFDVTSLSKTIKIEESGVYDVSLITVDEYDNASQVTYRIFADTIPPEIEAADLYVDITYTKDIFENYIPQIVKITDKDNNSIDVTSSEYADFSMQALSQAGISIHDNLSDMEALTNDYYEDVERKDYKVNLSNYTLIKQSNSLDSFKKNDINDYNYFAQIEQEYEQVITAIDETGNKSSATRKIYINHHCE